VLGFVSNTGIAGLTLGGGFGYLTRRFGWTSDNVLSMGVVTADGRVVRASDTVNSDLFWGLRGGGGNFGVVTDFEYKLYPIGPEIVGGAVAWRAEEAPAVLDLFRDLVENGSTELSCAVAIRLAPPAPWLPAEVHGKLVIMLLVCHTGPVANAEAEVARIKSFGSPVGDVVQRRTYVSQQSLLDASQPAGRRYYWKSEYLPGVDKDLFVKFLDHASRLRSPHSALILFPLAGALMNLPADHSPVGNRNASFVLNITGAWDDAASDEANIEWVRATWESLKEFSTGGTYINFQTEDEGDDRLRSAYGDHYDRLVEIKTKWDPGNLFHLNRNIRPLPGA
jgi:FAD/FMN-containing dehydrogenase